MSVKNDQVAASFNETPELVCASLTGLRGIEKPNWIYLEMKFESK